MLFASLILATDAKIPSIKTLSVEKEQFHLQSSFGGKVSLTSFNSFVMR